MTNRAEVVIEGSTFGRFTVVERGEPWIGKNYKHEPRWWCRCECGEKRLVNAKRLRNGQSKSCGCLHKELASKRFSKHRMSSSSEYGIWKKMRARAGACRTSVCERWIRSFGDFYLDMGPRPLGCVIDRIDANVEYAPGNCRWVTREQRARNTRVTRTVILDGNRVAVQDLAKRFNINVNTLIGRLRKGMSVNDAINMPVKERGNGQEKYSHPKRMSRCFHGEAGFWAQIDRSGGDDACWLWTGSKSTHGYGLRNHNGRNRLVHIIVYELSNGRVPKGLELDHLCRNTSCVNPRHLEAVTHRVNILRGDTFAAKHATKTHCPKGHPYDDSNTRYRKCGRRACKKCSAERCRLWHAKRKFVETNHT